MQRLRGFTLLELLIVIAIAAVVLSLAVPSFRSVLLNSRRADASTSLYGGLVAAHSEAIIRNQTVTVCQRSTSLGSSPQCDFTSGNWVNGWVAFVGTAGGTIPASSVLAVGEPTDPAFAVTDTSDAAAASTVQFLGNGRVALSNASSLTLKLCNTQNSTMDGRQIEIGLNGRVALYACSGCSCPTPQ